MIFSEILEEKYKAVSKEIENLIEKAFSKQVHPGDLLLVYVNGFYSDEDYGDNTSPFVFGPNKEGHSELLHYEFINPYREMKVEGTFEDYKKKLEYSQEKKTEIDELIKMEGMTIQLEMLIYLKIWEADAIIKRFYQLLRIVNGDPYDWYFKIAESSRDRNSTGTRQDIIRKKIRNPLQNEFPVLFATIKNGYKTQIRNSIAHSKYSFLGRNIQLNNYIREDKNSQLHGVDFDDWIKIFHDTLAFYNGYIQIRNSIQKIYSEMARINKVTEIRTTEKKEVEIVKYMNLEFRPQFNDWKWEHK